MEGGKEGEKEGEGILACPGSPESTRESRIAARRKRVMMKIEAAHRAAQGKDVATGEDSNEDHPEKDRISSKQIKQSEIRLDKLSTDGSTLVTNVKVAGDSKEVSRRQEEDEAKRARHDRLEAEVTAGAERFQEIMGKWSKSDKLCIPQDLHSLFQQQKAGCSAMVDEKDKLIGELQQELKAKDDQYVKNLRKQAEDVDLILERMEEQSRTLFKSYSEELAQIEKSFEDERRMLLDTEKADWDKATAERSAKEKFYLEDRECRIEKNEEEIQHLRVRNAEEVNQVKIGLEKKIQSLQQEVQRMKATFQLNAEKLEYNFQVLKKRDEENTVTISVQKRRITRLQDTLNNLRVKLTKQEKACKSEMQLLMDEYRKNTEQYRELMKKVKHFQAVDSKRFHDIWVMNEERVRKLAQDVECVDRLVHEQQMGLTWELPPQQMESPMAAKTLAKKSENRNVSKATIYASQIISEAGSEASSLDTEKIPRPPRDDSASLSTGREREAAGHHYTPALIKQVLEMLCSECEFLIESKLIRLLAPLDHDEQLMMKLDSIFKAVGIDTEEDVHRLVKHFVVKLPPPPPQPAPPVIVATATTTTAAAVEREREGSTISTTTTATTAATATTTTAAAAASTAAASAAAAAAAPVLVHPNEVLSCLTVFVREQDRSSGASTPFFIKPTVGNYEELLDGEFWKQMALTLPQKKEQVWSALIEGLEKYHTILKSRITRIDETDVLRQQNTELRLLLHQYMHARINQELEIPPTLLLPMPVQPSMV